MRVLGAPNHYRRDPTEARVVAVDVRALREHLGMTQAGFARRFGFALADVRSWEQGTTPHGEALALLHLIERNPQVVLMALPPAAAHRR
jgi:putative transcriptional regulator